MSEFNEMILPLISSSIIFKGDRTIHFKTIHLTPFYLETGYCHGRVRVRVRVSVWVTVGVRVCFSVMIRVRIE